MKNIYGIPCHTCGVYMITCKINNKKYIGSSKEINSRLALHFNRECRKYPYKPLYKDIIKYGRDNFIWEVLEECDPFELRDKEQYYFDLIQPEYNLVKPFTWEIQDEECRNRIEKASKENGKHLRELYKSEEYKKLFKEGNRYKFTPVQMLDKTTGECIMEFECLQDAARWITKNTNFKGKNKASKIMECCKYTRNSAFGYKWKYIE